MTKLLNWGSGYRTYIIAALMFLTGGVRGLGYIDESTYMSVMSVLGPTGLLTLRMGIK